MSYSVQTNITHTIELFAYNKLQQLFQSTRSSPLKCCNAIILSISQIRSQFTFPRRSSVFDSFRSPHLRVLKIIQVTSLAHRPATEDKSKDLSNSLVHASRLFFFSSVQKRYTMHAIKRCKTVHAWSDAIETERKKTKLNEAEASSIMDKPINPPRLKMATGHRNRTQARRYIGTGERRANVLHTREHGSPLKKTRLDGWNTDTWSVNDGWISYLFIYPWCRVRTARCEGWFIRRWPMYLKSY